MKHVLIALAVLLLSSSAYADKKSKSQAAAETWLKAFVDAKAAAPAYTKDKPLVWKIQSQAKKECKKEVTSGKATTPAEIKAVKTCFVATKNMVDHDKFETYDVETKWLDDEMKKFAKTAPKGTTYAGGTWGLSGAITFEAKVAIGPDDAVLGVWAVYLEQDGE